MYFGQCLDLIFFHTFWIHPKKMDPDPEVLFINNCYVCFKSKIVELLVMVDICPLDPYTWIRIILRIRMQMLPIRRGIL